MATSRRAWQRAEESAARLFGARRRVLSGSANRDDLDGDDATHERLFIESKLKAKWAIFTLWQAVRKGAKKAGKVPVIVLRQKNHPGMLLVVHSDDLDDVIFEWLAARSDDELNRIEHAVRLRRGGEGDEPPA